jgi:hypothetical protein
VKQIRSNILTAQSRQKSYTDKRCRPLEFEVGDHVYLRVSPMIGVHCFGIKEKLTSRYIGLYPIINKYGSLSYKVELPSKLLGVHNVFHISQLKRCLKPRLMLLLKIPSHWHKRPILSRFWTNKTESPTTRPHGFTRFNGMITRKMKPRGNMKTSYNPSTPSFFRLGNQSKPHRLYHHFNLGMRVLFKEGWL